MHSFDSEAKILSSIQLQPFFDKFVTSGQIALHYLQKDPSKVVQISYDDGISMTAGEMAKLGLRIAKNLTKEGFKLNDVIGVCAKNTTYLAPLVLASLIIGTPCSILDPTFDQKEISHIFQQTNPKIVFCDHDNYNTVAESLNTIENTSEIITVDEKIEGVRFISEMFELFKGEAEHMPRSFGIESYKIPGVILCSSGTTSISKGTILSHAHLILLMRPAPQVSNPTALCFSSLYWLSGFTILMLSLASCVKRVITKQSFRPLLLVHLIEQFKCNAILSPPSHIAMLVQSPVLKLADLSSVRLWFIGGAAVDKTLRKAIQDHLLYGTILVPYGMTEMGPVATVTDPFDVWTNSSGRLNPNFKMKIVDEDGNALDLNQVGEIYVMPPYKFLGYANNEESYKSTFDDEGWIKTGDLGYLSDDYQLYVVDRKKDLIKYLNYQVAPSEIEAFVCNIPGVQNGCVVGIPDMISGDLATAVVIKNMNSELTEQDIVDEVARNFPIFKRLHGGAYFVDSLPMTPSGKIKKILVRKMAAQMYKSQEINGNY